MAAKVLWIRQKNLWVSSGSGNLPLFLVPFPPWQGHGVEQPECLSRIRTVRPGLAPSEQVVAVALRKTLSESLAIAVKTSILVKSIRDRPDLYGTEAISLAG